jgi:hypothetical protein
MLSNNIMVDGASKVVSFRVSAEEYKHLGRIAGILSRNKKIKNDSVGTLARALTFGKVNEFIQIELMEKEMLERGALESPKIPTQASGYI